MRGSTPLDVAASSVMDNNGLALALEEPDLDKVSLSHCILFLLDSDRKTVALEDLYMHIKKEKPTLRPTGRECTDHLSYMMCVMYL